MSSSSDSSGLDTSDIVGIVVGVVLALVTIIAIIITCYAMCSKKNKPSQVTPYPPVNYQPYNPYAQPMNTDYYPQQPYPPQEPYWGPPPYNVQQQAYYTQKFNY